MGVVVLHAADRPAVGVGAGPRGGAVAGVPVGGQRRGRDAGERLEVLLGAR